jgi:hypothetical protein
VNSAFIWSSHGCIFASYARKSTRSLPETSGAEAAAVGAVVAAAVAEAGAADADAEAGAADADAEAGAVDAEAGAAVAAAVVDGVAGAADAGPAADGAGVAPPLLHAATRTAALAISANGRCRSARLG